jgi:folate-dependent tRNA-U54 methylase TrmFO/GidA
MHEIERVDYNKFFQLRQDNRRGHVYKLMKFRSNLDIRKYFFSQRTINYWNLLPSAAVEASSVNIFKNHVDRFLASIGGLYTSLSRLPVPLPRTTEDN